MLDLSTIPPLANGSHAKPEDGMCIMEAVAFIAREPWSDHPECVCPVIAAFLRVWNDALPGDERNALLRPLIPSLIGTRGSKALAHRRAVLSADWLIRDYTPTWLRLAKLNEQADALASLPEIIHFAQCPSIMPALLATRDGASAARDAARAAAWDAARAAAWDAAWDAARDAAWAATRAAARAAARAFLKPTTEWLQASALDLVARMIACSAAQR